MRPLGMKLMPEATGKVLGLSGGRGQGLGLGWAMTGLA